MLVSFKYKTKCKIVIESMNLSTALLAGRPEVILTLSPVAVWTHGKCVCVCAFMLMRVIIKHEQIVEMFIIFIL